MCPTLAFIPAALCGCGFVVLTTPIDLTSIFLCICNCFSLISLVFFAFAGLQRCYRTESDVCVVSCSANSDKVRASCSRVCVEFSKFNLK